MKRLLLSTNISINDFDNFYWTTQELASFCRNNNLKTSGNKTEITKRIRLFLSTGTSIEEEKKSTSSSKFNWNTESLHLNTIITDNYKNTQNVRTFMTEQIGKHFRFNTDFMEWMKENVGKTLDDAITEWKKIYDLKKDKSYKTNIAPQFEYNTYIRDYLADNPNKTFQDAINSWKIKRSLKGSNKYSKTDILN